MFVPHNKQSIHRHQTLPRSRKSQCR